MNKRITDFFRRETDGSWTCTETVTVDHPTGGEIHFTKGAIFHGEDVFMGVKVARWLDSLVDARH